MNCRINLIILCFLIIPILSNAENQYNNIASQFSELSASTIQEGLKAYFRYLAGDLTGKRVLDLGCGDGYDLSRINVQGAQIFGIDASFQAVYRKKIFWEELLSERNCGV